MTKDIIVKEESEPAVIPDKDLVKKEETLPKTVKKYKIVYDRNACIGAAACAAVAPQFWVIAEDGKADLVNHKLEDGKQVIFVSEDELTDKMRKAVDVHKEAAEVCPVRAIEVFDESGNKLV